MTRPSRDWWVIYQEPTPAEMTIVAVELPPDDDTAHDKRCAEIEEAGQRAYLITAPDADTASAIAMRVWADESVTSPEHPATARAYNAQPPHFLDHLETDMDPIALGTLCASVVNRFGVRTVAVESALLATLEYFHAESRNRAIAQFGLTPAEYLHRAMQTPCFEATLSTGALMADGREADARLNWEAYLQREESTAKRAHQAVPPTALLGDPDAIHRIGHRLGLSDEQTDQLTSRIVLTVATGYPYRSPCQLHLSLTDMLAQVTTEDLTLLLQLTALSATEHTHEPDSPR
ncbi:hypothetical protein [Streptomyces melanogenes]|uniref:hypothetical protein n=1 Tax=Streptomyces melanogenes TaxID=67326 RepID=UPI003799DE4E